jgi:hypothetical protein
MKVSISYSDYKVLQKSFYNYYQLCSMARNSAKRKGAKGAKSEWDKLFVKLDSTKKLLDDVAFELFPDCESSKNAVIFDDNKENED